MFNRSSLVQYLTTISWAISHWQNKHHLISVHISGWSHMLIFPKLPQSCLINPCFVGKSPLLYSSCLRLIHAYPTSATTTWQHSNDVPRHDPNRTSFGVSWDADQSIHGDFQWGYGAPRCKKCSQCLDWNLGWKEYMEYIWIIFIENCGDVAWKIREYDPSDSWRLIILWGEDYPMTIPYPKKCGGQTYAVCTLW